MLRVQTSKRFEFSAAHRLSSGLPEGRLHGHNYILWVSVTGPVDERTGMVVNVSDLKRLVNQVLDAYDHRNLNLETPRLAGVDPTTAAVARALWNDLRASISPPVSLAAVRLQEEGGPAAFVSPTALNTLFDGTFAAAHRTHAPRLSAEENRALYGICNNPSGHGHNYRVEAAFSGDWTSDPLPAVLSEFDHHNLNLDIADFKGRNVVTEGVAQLIWARLSLRSQGGSTPPMWVTVHELENFFARYEGHTRAYELSWKEKFNAAHRLHSAHLSAEENRAIFGKCNRPGGHGHSYFLEFTVRGELDPLTETAYDLSQLTEAAQAAVAPLDHRYLEEEVSAFRERPSTGENIAIYLWERLETTLGEALSKVRLWETPNNRFEVERGSPG